MKTKFLIIGGGIAGASLGYELAEYGSVIILEMESQAGYHTTGRSAAFYAETYGNRDIRPLTIASKEFLYNPNKDFSTSPFIHPRGALHVFNHQQIDEAQNYYNDIKRDVPAVKLLSKSEALKMQANLNKEGVAGAILDPDCGDLDVAAMHQAYLTGFKRRGGSIITNNELLKATFAGGLWSVEASKETIEAEIILNTSGAWADVVAERCGVSPIGIEAFRRTVITVPKAERFREDLPLTLTLEESVYFKPESGGYLISPCDETKSPACDAQPELEDVAVAIDRFERFSGIKVARVQSKWAGLRTFARDRSPVIGFDTDQEGFFWSVGQGGYGIQTSPAWARTAASLATGQGLPRDVEALGGNEARFSPARFKG